MANKSSEEIAYNKSKRQKAVKVQVKVKTLATGQISTNKRPPQGSVLERIKYCESKGNPLAKNKNSTAKGLYQFLDSSWNYYGKQLWGDVVGHNVYAAEDNEELAKYVYSKNGTRDWLASKNCWSK